jgi:sulfate/thiosulfate-binding protein
MPFTRRHALAAITGSLLATQFGAPAMAAEALTLLNVSYDPTRELYREINRAFAAAWKGKTGASVTINQSHGGSGAQARAVLDGLQADVVTLALAADIDALAKRGLIAADWQTRLPNNASPTTSTIVLLVRKGNPKAIKDWSDLLKPGVQVITPNPKTSGGARWNVLAAIAWLRRQRGYSEASEGEFLGKLFKQVPVLDTGARGATVSFAQRELGDVLIAWENEAWLARDEFGADAFEIIVPSVSILAEPPVALVDANVDKHGTRELAQAYLEFLYTKPAQEIAAKRYFRPRDGEILAKSRDRFPDLPLATISDFGGWPAAQAKYFADGGLFDQVYAPSK